MKVFRKASLLGFFLIAALVTFVGRSALNSEGSSGEDSDRSPSPEKTRVKRSCSMPYPAASTKEKKTDKKRRAATSPDFFPQAPFSYQEDEEGRPIISHNAFNPLTKNNPKDLRKVPSSLSGPNGTVFFLLPGGWIKSN